MTELMSQGINLALVGMGVVFGFLGILVLLTTVMSRVLARIPESSASTGRGTSTVAPSRDGPDPDRERLIAVISAAVRQHRSRQ